MKNHKISFRSLSFGKTRVKQPQRSQKGIVLIITLLVLVIMTLASIGLMRTIGTSTLSAGNYSFRASSDAFTMPPLEESIKNLTKAYKADKTSLYGGETSTSTIAVLPTGYSPIYANDDDRRGIPKDLLQTTPDSKYLLTDYSDGNLEMDANGQQGDTLNKAYVMIQRMCNQTGAPTAEHCFYGNGNGISASSHKNNEHWELWSGFGSGTGIKPAYRITVRVDGPNNTISFGQAIIYL
jgi:hypothetical protein